MHILSLLLPVILSLSLFASALPTPEKSTGPPQLDAPPPSPLLDSKSSHEQATDPKMNRLPLPTTTIKYMEDPDDHDLIGLVTGEYWPKSLLDENTVKNAVLGNSIEEDTFDWEQPDAGKNSVDFTFGVPTFADLIRVVHKIQGKVGGTISMGHS